MSLFEGAFSALSNVTCSVATAVSGLVQLTTSCVQKFGYDVSGRKEFLMGSAIFAVGIATTAGGYYLWKNVIKQHAVPTWQKWRAGSELYDPEYVLPPKAEWWRVVEEEEAKNPDLFKDVEVSALYRLDSVSDLSTTDDADDIVTDADDYEREEEVVSH